jgi:phosphate transport system permease protein
MHQKIQSKPRAGRFWRQGEPFVWATGAALSMTLTLTGALLAVVLWNGLGVFWPAVVAEIQLDDGTKLLGEEVERDTTFDTPRRHELESELVKTENELKDQQKNNLPTAKTAARLAEVKRQIEDYPGIERIKYKVGNMEDSPAFRWIDNNPDKLVDGKWIKEGSVRSVTYPKNAFVLERITNMNFYGLFKKLVTPDLELADDGTDRARLAAALAAVRKRCDQEIAPLDARQAAIAKEVRENLKYQIIKLDYQRKQLVAQGHAVDSAEVASLGDRLKTLNGKMAKFVAESDSISDEKAKLEKTLGENAVILTDSAGRDKSIPLLNIVRFTCPNDMGFMAKIGHYLAKIWELLSAAPRESNQEGGLFPAICGTVLMVFLMAFSCFPLGVIAGVYLGEYAKEGWLVRLVRIAVNNLAGIPSIVYGIFGMGFFIYLIGGNLDRWLFPERIASTVNEPVFGQGCILWASLTLGLLTIPVVIVSTEEALRAIPRGIREGSYALGATKLQTLLRVLIPMASPGMMTGFILAMARAAGEVAPLMLTGAIKISPVPMDSSFPFLHADRKFMHLGFHILDISCSSPNVEATKPMVYVTTLLLLFIVLTMSSLAIYMRNKMRKRYQIKSL